MSQKAPPKSLPQDTEYRAIVFTRAQIAQKVNNAINEYNHYPHRQHAKIKRKSFKPDDPRLTNEFCQEFVNNFRDMVSDYFDSDLMWLTCMRDLLGLPDDFH